MSIDNNDNNAGAQDVVKSQLASAYQDGVTGYGDIPENTRRSELEYAFKSSDPNDPTGPTPASTSAVINPEKIQNIATLSLSDNELSRVRQLLYARTAEDMTDAATIESIFRLLSPSGGGSRIGLEGSPDTNSVIDGFLQGADAESLEAFLSEDNSVRSEILDAMKNRFNESLNEAQTELLALRIFLRRILFFEETFAKGTWISLVDKLAGGTDLDSLMYIGNHRPFKRGTFDRLIHNRLAKAGPVRGSIDGFGGERILKPEVLKKLAYMSKTSSDMMAKKTTTALLFQSLYETEICMDYGVSSRFMKGTVFPNTAASTRDPSNPANAAYHVSAYPCFIGENRFKTLDELFFGHNPMETAVAGDPAKDTFSSPSATATLGAQQDVKNSLTGTPIANPIRHVIPDNLNEMSPTNGLVYLASIIGREFITSYGLSKMRTRASQPYLNSVYGTQAFAQGHSIFSRNEYLTGKGRLPLGKFMINARQGVMGPVNQETDPVYNIPPNASALTDALIAQDLQGFEPSSGESLMTTEILDRVSDGELNITRVGNNETLKSFVIDAIYNDPTLIPSTFNRFSNMRQYLNKYLNVSNSNFSLLFNCSRVGQQGHRGARSILSIVFENFGKILQQSVEPQPIQNRLPLSTGLVFLTHFLKPKHKGNKYNKFLKTVFLKRLVDYDFIQSGGTTDSGTPMLPSYGEGEFKAFSQRYNSGGQITTDWKLNEEPIANAILECMIELTELQPPGDIRYASVLMSPADTPSTADAGSPTNDYPGIRQVMLGETFMRYAMCSDIHYTKSIHAVIINTVKDIVRRHDPQGETIGNKGHTIANGMDRGQLVALVLEMFVMLSDMFLSSKFLAGASLSALVDIVVPGSEDQIPTSPLGRTLWEGGTGGSSPVKAHAMRVIPKLEEKNDTFLGTTSTEKWGLRTLGTSLVTFAELMRQLQAPELASGATGDFLKAVTPEPTSPSDKRYEQSGYEIGHDITLYDLRNMAVEAAWQTSSPAYSFGPFITMLSGFEAKSLTVIGSNANATAQGEGSRASRPVSIEDGEGTLLSAYENVPDRFRGFVSNISPFQLEYAKLRLEALEAAANTSPCMDATFQNQYLDIAALRFLDKISETGATHNFVFFGLPTALVRNNMISLSQANGKVSIEEARKLKYSISFQKETELSEIFTFSQNKAVFPEINFRPKVFLSRSALANAVRQEGVNTFDDIVEAAEFSFMKHPDYIQLHTGAYLISAGVGFFGS